MVRRPNNWEDARTERRITIGVWKAVGPILFLIFLGLFLFIMWVIENFPFL